MTEGEIIHGVQQPGRFDATVGSEADAVRIVKTALPHSLAITPGLCRAALPVSADGCQSMVSSSSGRAWIG
jgi:hypothetical protein